MLSRASITWRSPTHDMLDPTLVIGDPHVILKAFKELHRSFFHPCWSRICWWLGIKAADQLRHAGELLGQHVTHVPNLLVPNIHHVFLFRCCSTRPDAVVLVLSACLVPSVIVLVYQASSWSVHQSLVYCHAVNIATSSSRVSYTRKLAGVKIAADAAHPLATVHHCSWHLTGNRVSLLFSCCFLLLSSQRIVFLKARFLSSGWSYSKIKNRLRIPW